MVWLRNISYLHRLLSSTSLELRNTLYYLPRTSYRLINGSTPSAYIKTFLSKTIFILPINNADVKMKILYTSMKIPLYINEDALYINEDTFIHQ